MASNAMSVGVMVTFGLNVPIYKVMLSMLKSDKDDPEKGVNYLGFTISYKSPHESNKYATLDPHDSYENESEEEVDLQNTCLRSFMN